MYRSDFSRYIYFLLSFVVFFLFTYILYVKFDGIIKATKNEFKNIEIHKALHNAQVIEKSMKNVFEIDNQFLKEFNEQLYNKVSKFLSNFIDEEYKYVYIVYRDSKGRFYYLADGSLDADERGEFKQPFFPLEEKRWSRAFERFEKSSFVQKKIDSLWITYLYPLFKTESARSFLVLDVSTTTFKKIESILMELKRYLKYLLLFFFVSVIFILALYIQFYLSYRKNFYDPLTGVYNRNFLSHYERVIDPKDYVVAMMDIDFFKSINDVYGHQVGDEVLKKVARLLMLYLRKSDMVIRYGGEEFLLLIKNDDNFQHIIERLLRTIDTTPIVVDQKVIHVTVSIGVNDETERERNLTQAIKKADMQLYKAKQEGRNKIVYSSHRKDQHHVDFDKITKLIDGGNVVLYYQPIVKLGVSEGVAKFEALARLQDGDKLIYPNHFLDIILKTNYYVDFTQAVLQKAFQAIKEHHVEISVNLKKSDFLNDKLFFAVEKEIKRNKEIAQYLLLEILEDEQIDLEDERFFQRVKVLRYYGCKIALDDFGSGYSNLGYFISFLPDFIKIDGKIIKKLTNNDRARLIVRSIVVFSRILGIQTVAEFVDNKTSAKMLMQFGVDYAQGYYFAKPSPLLQNVDVSKIFGSVNTETA